MSSLFSVTISLIIGSKSSSRIATGMDGVFPVVFFGGNAASSFELTSSPFSDSIILSEKRFYKLYVDRASLFFKIGILSAPQYTESVNKP